MKKRTLLILSLVFLFALPATTLLASEKGSATAGSPKKASPFLITGKLPHLTKILMQEWDNPALQLTAPQKSKLLVVRKQTITGIKRLGKEINSLEKQVAAKIFAGSAPEKLYPLVQSIASLKTEATMHHLRCIQNTRNILNKQQLSFLMNR